MLIISQRYAVFSNMRYQMNQNEELTEKSTYLICIIQLPLLS